MHRREPDAKNKSLDVCTPNPGQIVRLRRGSRKILAKAEFAPDKCVRFGMVARRESAAVLVDDINDDAARGVPESFQLFELIKECCGDRFLTESTKSVSIAKITDTDRCFSNLLFKTALAIALLLLLPRRVILLGVHKRRRRQLERSKRPLEAAATARSTPCRSC